MESDKMGTGTPVNPQETITADKMNLKLETVIDGEIDVKASRTPGTEYQNSDTKRTLRISIFALFTLDKSDTAILQAHTRHPPNAQTTYGQIGDTTDAKKAQHSHKSLIMLVPPGDYYRVSKSLVETGTITINQWYETLI